MAALDEPAEEAEDSAADGGDTDVERQDGAATAREAHAQELLSNDQINQVGRRAMQVSCLLLFVPAQALKILCMPRKGLVCPLDLKHFTRAVIVKGMRCLHAAEVERASRARIRICHAGLRSTVARTGGCMP